jgi:hypothetical protein
MAKMKRGIKASMHKAHELKKRGHELQIKQKQFSILLSKKVL